jgi:hypothetical protein
LKGKTFEFYENGSLTARGFILGMVGPTVVHLVVTETSDGSEYAELRPVSSLSYDRSSKTGFKFSNRYNRAGHLNTENPEFGSLELSLAAGAD